MNKKSLLGLILFACFIITALFAGADYMISRASYSGVNNESFTNDEVLTSSDVDTSENNSDNTLTIASGNDTSDGESSEEPDDTADSSSEENSEQNPSKSYDVTAEEPWLSTNPTDMGSSITKENPEPQVTQAPSEQAAGQTDDTNADSTFSTSLNTVEALQLINNSADVDYRAYIPEMFFDSELEAALDVNNPDIDVDAEAAILFDANTMEVLYYKNAVQAMFPASTAKLLTALVTLEWCNETEEVTIGDEVKMIAYDSTKAYLKKGQILTIRNLMEGMLLPSGNDAAYVIAAYVGKKSLGNADASKEDAVKEFVRLMNEKAAMLGVKNSCFMTPDGYDALGQYTTAYDMGLIGIAAAGNSTILDITGRSRSRNIFVSGQDITWSNTNKIITRYSGKYYSKAIGLKTGTSTMAGRCLVAAAEEDGRKVVCVILNSTSSGRWDDAITLLKYGLD